MRKRSSCRKCHWVLVLIALVASAGFFVPWKSWLEGRIKSSLEAQGFPNVQLTVENVGLSGITLKDVSFGGGGPLSVQHMMLGYSLGGILTGHFNDVTIKGLSIEGKQANDQWTFAGRASPAQEAEPLSLPLTRSDFEKLPVKSGKLEEGAFSLEAPEWKLALPLNISWQKEPAPRFTYKATGLRLKVPGYELVSGDATLDASLNESTTQWEGEWAIKDVKVTGENPPVPVLSGHGTVTGVADKILIKGAFANADKTYRSAFETKYNINNPKKSLVTLIDTALPWNGGLVSLHDIKMAFYEPRPVNITVQVQKVAVNDLLQQLTGKKATGTGVISGTLPVTIGADGSIMVTGGALQADGPGTIAMPADVVPGDNENVALARDVLKNLHFSVLSVAVDNDKDNKLSVLMKVEGSNPDVMGGKAVKLNVHLTGDVLSFVQQNFIALTNPEKLLEKQR